MVAIAGSKQSHINPRSIKPLGNWIIYSSPNSCFNPKSSLGSLSILPDQVLLLIFSELPLLDLYRLQAVSKYFFAWSAALDGLWKAGFISRNQQSLSGWKGSWRSSYVLNFIIPPSRYKTLNPDLQNPNYLPTDSIQTPSVFSDVLFQPILCVNHSIQSILNPLNRSNSKLNQNIDKLTVTHPKAFKLPKRPTILKGLIDQWPAYHSSSQHVWTIDSLIKRYPHLQFRAESTLTTLADYRQYHDACLLDESPVYLFDSDFVEKSAAKNGFERGLGQDYFVPEIFQQDLFSCLGNHRPDHRWLIIGPARSGSTWHIDPNGTAAWNAVITGRKYWICFPPHVVPPGVLVNEDESEVESPLSISEWFLNYYQFAKETYGVYSKNPAHRGLMLEGICEAGETFFIPSGWWHLVINLESSIAITQNFVSESELSSVLHFMKYKPNQLSGFKFNDEDIADETKKSELGLDYIFEKFLEQLTHSGKIQSLTEHLNSAEKLELQRKLDQSTRLKKHQNHHALNSSELDHHQIIKKRKNQSLDKSDVSSESFSVWNQIKKKHHTLIDDTLNDSNLNGDVGEMKDWTNSHVIDSTGFKFQFDIKE